MLDNGSAAAFTHIRLEDVPAGTVNVHGHVHNNEPLRPGHHVNICVRHTDYRPLPLQASRRARQLSAARRC